MSLPEIHRFADPAALAEGAAERVAALLAAAIAQRGRASIALSGASTPQETHRRLATRPLDWSRIDIYFGDERCVPPDDPASNYRMARETLLDKVPACVHRIEGELPAAEAASRYASELEPALPLDVVMLGMGDDGHTASLFPGIAEPPPGAIAVATESPAPPRHRVTLTYEVIRGAGARVLLVCGDGKAARLAEVYGELMAAHPQLPIARVGPAIWMIDEAAASQLARRTM
jgi:6-phosphogluconolactonase